MNRRLLTLIFTSALALTSSASDQLTFAVQENTDATIYKLELRQGETARTIWSRRVPLINGKKPYDWCSLCKWAENEHGLLAIVENNEFLGQLLQFNASGDLLAEIEVSSSFLRDGGSQVRLIPPDAVEITASDGSVTKLLIRKGGLAYKDGKAFERHQPLHIGSQSYKTNPRTPPSTIASAAGANATPHPSATKIPIEPKPALVLNSEEPSTPTPWSIIVLIGVVCGLLWVRLKRRHRTTHGGQGANANRTKK